MSSPVTIFTDGACSGNPGPGGWGVILISPLGKVKEMGGAEPHTTNNKMELTASVEALRTLLKVKSLSTKEIRLYTDSTYVIKGITEWIHGWKRRGWKNQEGNDIANREIWEQLDLVANNSGLKVEWLYVPGHMGFDGNERCDEIAVAFAKNTPISLYDGPLESYSVDVKNVPAAGAGKPKGESAPKPKKSGKPVYLSLVDGKLHRDADWKTCEARVKGRHGVKFKKAESPEAEASILREWGLKG